MLETPPVIWGPKQFDHVVSVAVAASPNSAVDMLEQVARDPKMFFSKPLVLLGICFRQKDEMMNRLVKCCD